MPGLIPGVYIYISYVYVLHIMCICILSRIISQKTAASLYDLGILFVLFMGGMEVDLQALKKGWKLVLVNGLGQVRLYRARCLYM